MPRNLKLTLSYDGYGYYGWQIQPGVPTIQGLLAEVIESLTGERLLPQASGRTDAGVHALAQVASFRTESPIPLQNLKIVLNDRLPPSIRVLSVEEAAPDFHARHSARAKTYEYRIYRGEVCPPFLFRYAWHYPYPLDEAAMAAAAALVVGEHDFTSFAAADPDRTERPPGKNPPGRMQQRLLAGTAAKKGKLPPCGIAAGAPNKRRGCACWDRMCAQSSGRNWTGGRRSRGLRRKLRQARRKRRRRRRKPRKRESWSTVCAAMVSFITWCATWWEHFCWWARERSRRTTSRAF